MNRAYWLDLKTDEFSDPEKVLLNAIFPFIASYLYHICHKSCTGFHPRNEQPINIFWKDIRNVTKNLILPPTTTLIMSNNHF